MICAESGNIVGGRHSGRDEARLARADSVAELAVSGSIVYVHAGPGYGKSWFLHQVGDSIRCNQVSAGRVSHRVCFDGSAGHRFGSDVVRFLTEALEALGNPEYSASVLIDDYHLLEDDEELPQLMVEIVRTGQGRVSIALASRHRMPIRLQSLLSGLHPCVISSDQLLIESREAVPWLSRGSEERSLARLARTLYQLTGGYATAIEVVDGILRDVREGVALTPATAKARFREEIGTYFHDTINSAEYVSMKPFLLDSAHLRYITKAIVDEVAVAEDAVRCVDELLMMGLFLHDYRGVPGVYRFLPVFGQFLQTYASRELSRTHLKERHIKAAEVLSAHGQRADSLFHYANALEYTRLGPEAMELAILGEHEAVAECISIVPESEVRDNASLVLAKGLIGLSRGKMAAIADLERAAVLARDSGESKAELRALILLSTVFRASGRLEADSRIERRAFEVAMAADQPRRREYLLFLRCRAAQFDDRPETARDLLSQARAVTNDWFILRHLDVIEGMVLLRLGYLSQAEQFAETRLEEDSAGQSASVHTLWLYTMALARVSGSNVENALATCDELWTAADEHGLDGFKGQALLLYGMTYLRVGNDEWAGRMYKQAISCFTMQGERPMELLARLGLLITDGVPASERDAQLRGAKVQIGRFSPGNSGGLRDIALMMLAVAASRMGDLQFAASLMLSVHEMAVAKSAAHQRVSSGLHLSDILRRMGDESRSRRYLEDSLALASTYRYSGFLFQTPDVLKSTLESAISLGIEDEYCLEILKTGFVQGEGESISPLMPSPRSAVGVGLRLGLSQDGAVDPPASAAYIRTLGQFSVGTAEGKEYDIRWKTRKVKGLFKHLVLNLGTRFTREELASLFWPEARSLSDGLANLRVALSCLRDILESMGIRDLLVDDLDTVSLRDSERISVDAEEFSSHLAQAGDLLRYDECSLAVDELRKAIALYGGDLLCEDAYEDWFGYKREELKSSYEYALAALAGLCAKRGDVDESIVYCNRLIRVNPLREDIYLLLMRMLHAAGRTAEAISTYHECGEELQNQLGIGPGPELVDYVTELLSITS